MENDVEMEVLAIFGQPNDCAHISRKRVERVPESIAPLVVASRQCVAELWREFVSINLLNVAFCRPQLYSPQIILHPILCE